MLYNHFSQFKRDTLIDIKENGIDDKSMVPWVNRFNELLGICTIYCCDGIIGEKEREELRKMYTKNLKEAGVDFDSLEIPHLRHPYIAFVMDRKIPLINEWDIEGIKYCPTDVGSDDNAFTVGVRRSHFVVKKFDYFFHFPTGEDFDEKMKKVYYKVMKIIR